MVSQDIIEFQSGGEPNSSPCVLLYEDELSRIADGLPEGVNVLSIPYPWDAETVAELTGQSDLRSASPLGCVIALMTCHHERLNDLVSLRARLAEFGYNALPEPRIITLHNFKKSGQLVDIVSVELVKNQARTISSLSRQLAQMRRRVELLQNQYHDLEIFLDKRQIQPCEAVFTAVPAGANNEFALRLSADDPVGQILPVSSKGVIAVSVYVTEVGPASSTFHLTLRTMEDDGVVGHWSVPGNHLTVGWNIFGLGRSLGGLRRTLRLELDVAGHAGELALALSELQPIARYCPSPVGGSDPCSTRHLAIMVWAGLPNLLPPNWINTADIMGISEIILNEAALLRATQTTDGAQTHQAGDVAVIGKTLNVRVASSKEALFELRGVILPGTVRVAVNAYLPEEARESVLLKLRAARSSNFGLSSVTPSTDLDSTEWISIAPGSSVAIDLYLSEPVKVIADLQILTRLALESTAAAKIALASITIVQDNLTV